MALAVLGLSACQATITVGIDVSAGGSGTVSVRALLDHEAAQSVPDLAAELHVSDLVQAGWRIDGPHPTGNGGMTITASKAFRDPAEAQQVIAEVSGPNGPFRDFQISRHHSVFSSRTTIRGTVDLTCGLQCFSDPALQQQLAGANLGSDASRAFAFDVQVRLPGGRGAAWQGKLGDKTTLVATSRTWDTTRITLSAVGVGLVVVLTAAFSLRRRVRSR